MKRKPTFRDLIEAYGSARFDEGFDTLRSDRPANDAEDAGERASKSFESLCYALRKVGVPLDVEAPRKQ